MIDFDLGWRLLRTLRVGFDAVLAALTQRFGGAPIFGKPSSE